jgi:anti-sigma regulatory factor (Ser/Thr protein kinase)
VIEPGAASVTFVLASTGSDAIWELPAVPETIREMRRHTVDFATAMGASDEMIFAAELVVSETVTNAVVHAYAGREPGQVCVRCRSHGERLVVEVIDGGAGLAARDDSPGIGQGLALVGALVESLEITPRPDGPGTIVRMSFAAAAPASNAPRLESLCALAVERVADVSCLDVVSGGVLRRVTAEVAGAPALTTWLRGTAPPAKPGTATWQALREGGAHLVVHDPSVPRSPGGTGEQLGLTWWVSVALEGSDGTPAALWGLGGRDGGRAVPPEDVISTLAHAARTDLGQESQQGALRARLALS